MTVELGDLAVEPGEVFFPLRILRQEFCQPCHDFLALAQIIARLCLVARLLMRIGELGKSSPRDSAP
jgi:hypothetical protein